ncbi:Kelch repeat-containing protein [Trypanosoma theileri]|uniref:Kelch repeat-containing protein n=1 Tax=Trypanosoma theileri TaxID=67003 RepID=A0A1X0P6Z1_9TRYP|nr:Kelch repeat-containing protein [Trypanosoma theileri]ORC92200.1 Kelch repeat-containing protein [Trypanosoma theileri]
MEQHDSSIIHLNVGGHHYSTRAKTLRAHPYSVLGQMFTNPIAVSKDAKDNSYFIDRNGSVFGYILDYLRTGTLVVPRDPITYLTLRREVGFYGLPVYAQLPPVQPAAWEMAPMRYRHVRITVEELEKHIEWEEGTLPNDLETCSLAEIVDFFSRRGYKIASEYTHRGSKGLTSVWMSKKERFPAADVAMEVTDTPMG